MLLVKVSMMNLVGPSTRIKAQSMPATQRLISLNRFMPLRNPRAAEVVKITIQIHTKAISTPKVCGMLKSLLTASASIGVPRPREAPVPPIRPKTKSISMIFPHGLGAALSPIPTVQCMFPAAITPIPALVRALAVSLSALCLSR